MAPIVYGVVAPPPVPPPNLWPGLDMTWAGWDGSLWSLTNPSLGSVMLPGVRGWNMPPVDHFADEYPGAAGSTWRNFRVKEREVFWPIQIFSDASSADWIARDAAWWKTMDPGREGVWTVIQPSGEKRSLKLRFEDDGNQQFDLDPALVGWSNYGITFKARQPYWEGDKVVRTFNTPTSSAFFSGPTVTISSGSSFSQATAANAGDVAVWPTWYIGGPSTTASVGINGSLITAPFDIPAGQELVIVTDPFTRSATLAGADKMLNLSARNFTALPGGKESALSLSMTGTGYIRVEFTPRYYRAW